MSLVNVDASQLKAFGTTLAGGATVRRALVSAAVKRSEEHTSELQSRGHLVCRLLLEKKKEKKKKKKIQ